MCFDARTMQKNDSDLHDAAANVAMVATAVNVNTNYNY